MRPIHSSPNRARVFQNESLPAASSLCSDKVRPPRKRTQPPGLTAPVFVLREAKQKAHYSEAPAEEPLGKLSQLIKREGGRVRPGTGLTATWQATAQRSHRGAPRAGDTRISSSRKTPARVNAPCEPEKSSLARSCRIIRAQTIEAQREPPDDPVVSFLGLPLARLVSASGGDENCTV